MPTKIEISTKTILFIALLIASVWLIVLIRDIIFLVFISFIIMSALRPVVDRLEKFRIPRSIAILLLYTALIGLIFTYGSFVFPPLVSETIRLINTLPEYIARLPFTLNFNSETLIGQIAPLGQNVARFTVGILSNAVSIFTILVFAFYFLLERNHLTRFLDLFVGKEWAKIVGFVVNKAELRMGAWVRGQLLLMILIGQASYIGLTLLGVNYALPLALIAGVLELFPIIGPNVSAIPAILIALTVSPGLALAVVALYFIIQQVENNIIVPTVMRRTVGMPPLISLLALMIGGKIGGVIGIILAVPTVLVIQTIIAEVLLSKKK